MAVISGGPDSITYAALWRDRGYEVHPIAFDYGQKGRKEIRVMKSISGRLGFLKPVVLDVSSMASLWRRTQLTDPGVKVGDTYSPSVVVPLRNGVFLMIASAYALSIGASRVVYGAHMDDIAGRPGDGRPMYPDCTPEFACSLEEAIARGHFEDREKLEIWSPAREGMTKGDLLRQGWKVLGDLLFETWSCYLSGRWHCGRCESCRNRKKAFAAAGLTDKTLYASERSY